MSTTLKLELLNDALDTNGIGLDLPANAIGIVGPEVDSGFKVVRAGEEVAVKPGTVLLKGDIIRTGSMAQTIFLSSTQSVAMTKVALAANYQLNMDTSTVLSLEGEVTEVAATEALNPNLLAMAEGETSGLFGALGAASLAGVPIAPVAAAGVAIAALGGGSGGGDSADAGNTNNGGGTLPPDTNNGDTGGTPAEPAPAAGGPFSSGGSQLDGAIAGNPTGQTPPFSFADGGAMLEGALPIPAAANNEGMSLPVDIGSAAVAQSVLTLVQPAMPAGPVEELLTSGISSVSSAAGMLPINNSGLPVSNLI